MIARSIAILFFVLSTKAQLTEGIDVDNYFRLINDVYRHYRMSCVIFVRSSNYDLNTATLVHTWSREFSWQRVMTTTITFSDLTSKYDEYQKNMQPLFVVLLDTRGTMDEFAETTRNIKPMSFPVWLVVFLQRPGNPLEEYCRHPTDNVFNVDLKTRMLVLCYNHMILVEWYALRDNRTRTFDLATWSPDRGLILKTQKNLYARRSNMFGEALRMVSVNNSPLISLKNGRMRGFFGLLMLELGKVMNFTVQILDPVEGFGRLNKKENCWTGAVGQLVVNKADIGVSAFTMTTTRRNVVDFTMPLVRSRYRIYFKEPKLPYVQWSLYLRAFSFELWITLLMTIIITSILLSVMKTKGYFSLSVMSENCIRVWGIYCQQGLPHFPTESPMRLAFLSIYVSSIIILSIYSASLISYLALATPKLPFTTVEGFVEHGYYKLIVMKNSAEYDVPSCYQRKYHWREFVKESFQLEEEQYLFIQIMLSQILQRVKDPVLLKMYSMLEEKYLPETLSEGFKNICQHTHLGFYTTEVFKESMDMFIRCKVVYIDSGRIDNMGLILAKGSPYTGFINYHLRRFYLNGMVSKLQNNYLSKNNRPRHFSVIIDITDITPVLTLVIGSVVLAVLILMIEKKYYSSKTRSKNNEEEPRKTRMNSVNKLSRNFGVKNALQGSERNLIFEEFYNRRLTIGYNE